MSRFINITATVLALALLAPAVQAAAPLTNLGRPATTKEVAAWDIDVRPDFKGLPKGSGSVSAGMKVWEGKCASCHGTFGESNEVFTPIVGGIGPDDIKTGRVASLTNGKQPQKTTLMKVATVSTLWDYINRAMPWTAPKSLTTDEVYAVTAYILNMGEILPDDFVLSDKTIAQAQQRMPNRNGMSTKHGMWDVRGKGDVASVACMKNCPVEATIRSSLPEASRNAHGNLALQNRTFGAVRGVDTSKPAPAARIGAAANAAPAAVVAAPANASAGMALMQQNVCIACHAVSTKVMGPSFVQVGDRYRADPTAAGKLIEKVKNGSSGAWGPIPMPPQGHVKDDDIKALVQWILAGAK
ncbi:c-type cytochrome [Massilia sp. TWR1-2-2]|uniref:c-type cytochrome n=1 Tax=Massilia sp. TWR1-2-2 TaxID=2804584 RepID=UPI003CE7C54C